MLSTVSAECLKSKFAYHQPEWSALLGSAVLFWFKWCAALMAQRRLYQHWEDKTLQKMRSAAHILKEIQSLEPNDLLIIALIY